ncbi:DUF1858 domain-containing protein [archaeon]|nr:DUF1858 domain-containing protein [archaeon]
MFLKNAISVFKMQINKDTIIGECIRKVEGSAEYLLKRGFFCVGCAAANFESLGVGLRMHGKTDEEIEDIIKELNKMAKND